MKKLNLGCGWNKLSGWINVDYVPKRFGCEYMDVTEEFPYDTESIDYIYSEHLIEHIEFSEGIHMLSECYRVLKPGGKVRISTPDLKFLVKLYTDNKTDLQKGYVEYSVEQYRLEGKTDTFVINNFVRGWGHTFIYDEKTLRDSLESVRFSNIRKYSLGKSHTDVFKNLDNIKRLPEGHLELETFTLEGKKC